MLSDSPKILMLATTAAMIEQFNKNNILILEKMGFEIHVAGNWNIGNPISNERLDEFKNWLQEHHGKWFQISATRKPTDVSSNIKAYREVVSLINRCKYKFIHCHTPIGSVIGRLAAKKTNTPIVYTAHGFHFYKGAPLKNWLLYYPVEWICSWMTDILITINTEDYERAKRHLHAKKTEYVPGVGVDIENFSGCCVDKKEKCKEFGIPDDKFILLSVGELQERKNQRIVIDALGKMQNQNIYYLIAGQGALKEEYEQLIKSYGLQDHIKLLGYRTDIDELCEIADCFVHTAFHEGLSVALLEAMASKLPIIASDARGIRDLVINNKGGLYINPKSVDEVQNAIQAMYSDKDFRNKCGFYNFTNVKKYSIENINKIMDDKYKTFVQGEHIPTLIKSAKKRMELGLSLNDFVLISVGELNPNKNHEIVIKVIASLNNSHIKYIVCGQGELESYLLQKIKQYKLQEQIMLLGYRTDIGELLNLSDAFIFPSKREGLSVALMEAMACGLPVICQNIRGNNDLIEEGRGGYLIKGQHVDTYAWAVKELLREYRKKEEMGSYNQEKIKKFSQCQVNKTMKHIYLTAID